MCSCRFLRWMSLAICSLVVLSPLSATAQVANFSPDGQSKIVPPNTNLVRSWMRGEFTEGPAPMANGNILFSDIGNRIMRFGPTSQATTVFREPSGKANGLMFDPQGRLIACEGAGFGGKRRISITELDGRVRTLADSFEGKRFNSPNDLAITRSGSVYFTDPRYVGDEPRDLDFEGVFLVEPDGKVKLATRDVEKPNGILVSADQSIVYVADNNSDPAGAHTLLAFDVGPDGKLENKRVLFDFGPNKRGIDGMTLDQQGNIYATAGSGAEGGVYVFTSQGQPLAFISIPGDPTNCVFGVGKWARRLYITAAGPPPERGQSQKFGLYFCDLTIPGYHVYPQMMP